MKIDQIFLYFVDQKTTDYSIMQIMSQLILSKEDTSSKIAGSKRLSSVREAITWPRGKTMDDKIPKVLFKQGRYTVRLSKPGKEAATDYNNCKYKDGTLGNNPNDMRPEITIDGKLIEKNATFRDVFEELQKLHRASTKGVSLMGCLLGRSAYMADHKEVSSGIWRYSPDPEIIRKLSKMIPIIYDVPVEIFLHYLNALALNEDTKYHTLGYDVTKDTGRRNNLLTCVNLIGVLLDRVSIADFAGSFSRPPTGISAISQKKMREIFPELSE